MPSFAHASLAKGAAPRASRRRLHVQYVQVACMGDRVCPDLHRRNRALRQGMGLAWAWVACGALWPKRNVFEALVEQVLGTEERRGNLAASAWVVWVLLVEELCSGAACVGLVQEAKNLVCVGERGKLTNSSVNM